MKISGLQNNPNDTQSKVSKFLHLVDMDKYEFINYEHIEKDEEIRKIKSIVPINLPRQTDKWEFIVPIQYLNNVQIPKDNELDFITHENGEEFLREVNNAINFTVSINFSNYLEYIDECTSLHWILYRIKYFLNYILKNYWVYYFISI